MAQLLVRWEKEVVSHSVGLLYRVFTLCQNPVDFPSPAVFLLDNTGVYQNVCSFADFVYYLVHPEIYRFHLPSRANALDLSYLNQTFSIENTTITGILRRYNVQKNILCCASLSALPPMSGVFIISNGSTELRLPYSGVIVDNYYRSPSCSVVFSDPDAANEHVARQRERIVTLLTSWERVSGKFEEVLEETLRAKD